MQISHYMNEPFDLVLGTALSCLYRDVVRVTCLIQRSPLPHQTRVLCKRNARSSRHDIFSLMIIVRIKVDLISLLRSRY